MAQALNFNAARDIVEELENRLVHPGWSADRPAPLEAADGDCARIVPGVPEPPD